MPSIETIELTGVSGTTYPFDVFPLNTVLAKHGAVYAITKRTGTSGEKDHKRIFIGETDSLRHLIQTHTSKPCFAAMGADHVCLYMEDSKDCRIRIAGDLLAGDSWACNPRPRQTL